MLNDLRLVITDETSAETVIQKVFNQENTIDEVQIEVTKFLTDLLSEELSHDVADEARTQLRLADELESVSDDVSPSSNSICECVRPGCVSRTPSKKSSSDYMIS